MERRGAHVFGSQAVQIRLDSTNHIARKEPSITALLYTSGGAAANRKGTNSRLNRSISAAFNPPWALLRRGLGHQAPQLRGVRAPGNKGATFPSTDFRRRVRL